MLGYAQFKSRDEVGIAQAMVEFAQLDFQLVDLRYNVF